MFKKIFSKLTNNFVEVPLLYITFDLNKYKKHGAKNSCLLKIHPAIQDEHVVKQLNDIVDYIRDNYDMDQITK